MDKQHERSHPCLSRSDARPRGLWRAVNVTIGQREQARTELSAAVDLYRTMEMTLWLPETEAALAQVEGR